MEKWAAGLWRGLGLGTKSQSSMPLCQARSQLLEAGSWAELLIWGTVQVIFETTSQELKQENADLWAGDNTSIYVALGQWLKFAFCWIKMFWWCGAKWRLVKYDSWWQATVTNIEMLTLPYLHALLTLLVPKLKSSPVLWFVFHWVRCCRVVRASLKRNWAHLNTS